MVSAMNCRPALAAPLAARGVRGAAAARAAPRPSLPPRLPQRAQQQQRWIAARVGEPTTEPQAASGEQQQQQQPAPAAAPAPAPPAAPAAGPRGARKAGKAGKVRPPPPPPSDAAPQRPRRQIPIRGVVQPNQQQQLGPGEVRWDEGKLFPEGWEEMDPGTKAYQFAWGKRGILFWLSQLAWYGSITLGVSWAVFRFIGPALGLYTLKGDLLPTMM
ncbi:MAG: hypothetical protein J3K34DRAFT_288832 [Monoraphidium minutum]|nr:MAG: hypothetical protein J3K34DRAFT_288832 [Monoraphidium minutum]